MLMPKVKRLDDSSNVDSMLTTMVGFRVDAETRAMLEAIATHEERVPSDMLRMLIKRAYRALPSDAQTVPPRARRGKTGT